MAPFKADETCPEREAQVCRVSNPNWTLRAAWLITQLYRSIFPPVALCGREQRVDTNI